MILPAQRRQKKEQENLMSNLKKNDEIVTTSGIVGIVTHIKEGGNEVTIKSEDSRLKILRSSIAQIVKKDETPAAPVTPPAAAPTPPSTDIKP